LTHGKKASFAECLIFDTRQTCRDHFHSVTYFFSPSVVFSSRQSLCLVPDRKHSAKLLFAGTVDVVCSLPSVTLGKSFAECFSGFAECLWHTAKLLFPVVADIWLKDYLFGTKKSVFLLRHVRNRSSLSSIELKVPCLHSTTIHFFHRSVSWLVWPC